MFWHLSARRMRHFADYTEQAGCQWPDCAWHLRDPIERSLYIDDGRFFYSADRKPEYPPDSAAKQQAQRARGRWGDHRYWPDEHA